MTLQLASSQFSPRLLRTFTRDLTVQLTLSLFLATFTFSLTVLRSVRTGGDGIDLFVPRLSVTLAFLMAVASVLSLVFFLAHLAKQIRVETMLREVHADGSVAVDRIVPDVLAAADPPPALPDRRDDAVPVLAARSGFLVRVAEDEILRAAVDADAIVLVDRCPGASVVAGTPVGWVWPRTGAWTDDRERLTRPIADALHVGFERIPEQDLGLSLRQLTDVAVKALSPGVNDPTTAVHALSHSAALLCELSGRRVGPTTRSDDDGVIRVVLARPDLAQLLDEAVAEPRRFGGSDPRLLARLFQLLRELAWCLPQDERRPVADELDRLRDSVAAHAFPDADRARLDELAGHVEAALGGRWPA